MTDRQVHVFCPPPTRSRLKVWHVWRDRLDAGGQRVPPPVSYGRWPAFTAEEALLAACQFTILGDDGPCLYRVVEV